MLDWTHLLPVERQDIARYVNLQWLAGYRHPRFAPPDIEFRLNHELKFVLAGIDVVGNGVFSAASAEDEYPVVGRGRAHKVLLASVCCDQLSASPSSTAWL
jgi:hypothetical protein